MSTSTLQCVHGLRSNTTCFLLVLAALAGSAVGAAGDETSPVTLPGNVKAVWDLNRAWRESTPTRERVCINGLWRWQPALQGAANEHVPAGEWGYFKVPGCWPGTQDYLQQDCQTVFSNPTWSQQNLAGISAAWYQRDLEIPAGWTGRRVVLSMEYLNSFAAVYTDGKKVGEARFPAGQVDLTSVCQPGSKHTLSILVIALPLKGVRISYSDTAAAREVKGSVPRRGLCGDVYLIGRPSGPCLDQATIQTSFRQSRARFIAKLEDLDPSARYALRGRITKAGKDVAEFTSKLFGAADLDGGQFAFSENWKPEQLWDLDTPENLYDFQLSLLDAGGKVLDASGPERFGFRELWIDGRDFYLNGTRLYLSSVPVHNAAIGAAWANYAAARETFERLKGIGINFVYTSNYDCEPGSHLSFDEILRAADDAGMLVALTQPHFSAYDWKAPDADQNNGYARDAAFYARVAGNHPSVVFYSTSHNATGYDGDMDPDMIDGIHDLRDTWASRNAKQALRAEAIIHHLDPTRIVYHHAGGNIGSMHTINFYPNFAPMQELSDWFEHWATVGVKPLFLCEYAAPMTWDWTMYRGWYKGHREFGSADVPWEFCLSEWNAQFLGDRAFAMSELEKRNLRWEARQFAAGKVWHRWDYPTPVGAARFDHRDEILAQYQTDNWRAYRTWGVSGISPWDYEIDWVPRDGTNRKREELPVDWDNLQRPGISADYIDRRLERMDVAFGRSDWVPTPAGKALLRNNQPVLTYIGGKPDAFTSKDHLFRAGETVEKQLILINNSRRTLTFQCDWSLNLPHPVSGNQTARVETGQQARIPLRFELPGDLAPGSYELHSTARFGSGKDEQQTDSFHLTVLPAPLNDRPAAEVALFDPVGQTAALLKRLGIPFHTVSAGDALPPDSTLVIGKFALSVDGPAPDVSRVQDGMKVIVFEQSSETLEKRLGFRTVEYGLRQVFERIPDSSLLVGITPDQLHDWRGEATTIPPRLSAESVPMHGPTVLWCDIPVSRVWRCGNRGSVASVLIEKPALGDFLPILDGGFDLQYAPLLEYRQGKGVVLFCQLDVTGRTEAEPAADAVVLNVFRYTATWKPASYRQALYAGEPAGNEFLKSIGLDPKTYERGQALPSDAVLIIGPGGGEKLSNDASAIAQFLHQGGRLVGIGLNQQDTDAILTSKIAMKRGEHICAFFETQSVGSPLAGIGPGDVESRAPLTLPMVTGGATIVGDGVLAFGPLDAKQPSVVLCQLTPWHLDYENNYGLKRTYRRASFAVNRLLANLGVAGSTPLLERIKTPVPAARAEKRWLNSFYLDVPQEWDDPYRFFRW